MCNCGRMPCASWPFPRTQSLSPGLRLWRESPKWRLCVCVCVCARAWFFACARFALPPRRAVIDTCAYKLQTIVLPKGSPQALLLSWMRSPRKSSDDHVMKQPMNEAAYDLLPLHAATVAGDIHEMRACIERGECDVNAQDDVSRLLQVTFCF